MKYDKFSAIRAVVLSNRKAPDKAMLVELIMCCDSDWYCFPSVQRLCQARGMKHEKNFKGAETLLSGLVTTHKRGRKNGYTLNMEAIMALEPAEVQIKHTPATAGKAPVQEGENNPLLADDDPAGTENTPVEQGAYSTRDTTEDSTSDSTRESMKVSAGASTLTSSSREDSPTLPLPPLTGDPSSCDDYGTSDRTRGSAAALADKGHLVPSGSSVWEDDEVEW